MKPDKEPTKARTAAEGRTNGLLESTPLSSAAIDCTSVPYVVGDAAVASPSSLVDKRCLEKISSVALSMLPSVSASSESSSASNSSRRLL